MVNNLPGAREHTHMSGATSARTAAKACPKLCPPPCPVMPALPDQGGIMPVLWQPTVQTNLNVEDPAMTSLYTLNVITTQWIDKGILFRFQMYPGLTSTYELAIQNSALAEFDLVVRESIPPGTVLVVSMTQNNTALWGYTGTTQYSNTGSGISPTAFVQGASLLAFAFAPTTSGGWMPAQGQPQFAIGFNYKVATPDPPYPLTGCSILNAIASAPNFPDQFAPPVLGSMRWIFDYSVVYPAIQRLRLSGTGPLTDCIAVPGIKYEYGTSAYATGSWSNLRAVITQPYTVIEYNYISVSHWNFYSSALVPVLGDLDPADVGPFGLAAMPGQLAVVYFRPLPYVLVQDTPYPGYDAAEIALLVTAPLQPNTPIYFTTDEYDSVHNGFGPRKSTIGSSNFVNTGPSFQWITGSRVIPAGTVVFIQNIGGTGAISIIDAHDSLMDVGAICFNRIQNASVSSLIILGVWTSFGTGTARPIFGGQFVTAALSNQYAGDFPPLSPCLTINQHIFHGPAIYGQGQVYDNMGLPGTVQAPMINTALFKNLPKNTFVPPTTLPAFRNMAGFHF